MCRDQVYDPDFDKAVMSKHRIDMPNVESDGKSIGERLCKRKKSGSGFGVVDQMRDLKGPKESALMRDQRAKSCYPLGLRGLNNLGNTCFMNSVLQAMLHAPPLRSYFLTNQHNRETCRKRSVDRLCLPCDIDGIFSAVFSGDRPPYSPAQFLYRSALRHICPVGKFFFINKNCVRQLLDGSCSFVIFQSSSRGQIVFKFLN